MSSVDCDGAAYINEKSTGDGTENVWLAEGQGSDEARNVPEQEARDMGLPARLGRGPAPVNAPVPTGTLGFYSHPLFPTTFPRFVVI